MFNSETVKAVAHDLWQFIVNGFSSDAIEEVGSSKTQFKPGDVFLGSSQRTNHIRLLLTKEYNEVTVERPLQQSEYVSFLLTQKGITLPSESKNWSPGTWHERLRGQSGVHISVVPTEGAVMEYRNESDIAVTAYVHEITDDETIRFGTVGMYQPGVYEEVGAPVSIWHEFRPVFVSFTQYG